MARAPSVRFPPPGRTARRWWPRPTPLDALIAADFFSNCPCSGSGSGSGSEAEELHDRVPVSASRAE
ncbi:hypothetical protein ACGFZK_21630 [Streptomyces sp. NPDC048257]|uniref:hypothetical protein n=1 Tax=Streptomyces sp. NPDC048257 TaxID=3365526 RepID=UPI003719C839